MLILSSFNLDFYEGMRICTEAGNRNCPYVVSLVYSNNLFPFLLGSYW